MIRHIEAWVMARLLAGESVNGEREALSNPLRRLADHLAARPPEARREAWEGFLCSADDGDEIILAVATADPVGPPPGIEPVRFATIVDVRRGLAQTRWSWKGWIPSASIVGIGAAEGTGKTRFALDLCKRVYHGEPWPDGQLATLAAGTRSVWMCADAHQDELAEMLPTFGLPDDAIVFPTSPDEPYGGTDLDEPETLAALEAAIIAVKPGLIFIDTLTSATSRDLCDQRTIKPLKASLAHLAQTYGVSVILQLHLSREGQALGRRIKGVTRTLLHLECPDPARSERLRLWVEKSYAKKPPAIGVTMGNDGNKYDFEPPKAPPKNPGGRPLVITHKFRPVLAGCGQ